MQRSVKACQNTLGACSRVETLLVLVGGAAAAATWVGVGSTVVVGVDAI